jgi:nucleoside triphosphate diphosphatase
MVDELGDVLFQVMFLSLLLEERGEGDLAAVAESCSAKLIRRHPHVYGDRDERARDSATREMRTAGEVLSQWEEIKQEVEGRGKPSELPENLPALLYARKVLRRVDPEGSAGEDKPGGPQSDPAARADAEQLIGTLLMEAVAASRRLGVDPELALRQTARRLVE